MMLCEAVTRGFLCVGLQHKRAESPFFMIVVQATQFRDRLELWHGGASRKKAHGFEILSDWNQGSLQCGNKLDMIWICFWNLSMHVEYSRYLHLCITGKADRCCAQALKKRAHFFLLHLLKSKLFYSFPLFSSFSECTMNTLILLHPTWSYITFKERHIQQAPLSSRTITNLSATISSSHKQYSPYP